MTLFIVDASDFHPINVTQVADAGVIAITHKSTEQAPGGVFRHANYGPTLNACRNEPRLLGYGTYIVPRSGISVATQIQTAVAYLDQQTPWWRTDPKFFLQVDLERWQYDSVEDEVGEDMTRRLRTTFGKKVLTYGSKGQYPGGQLDADMLKWNANYPAENSRSRLPQDVYAAVGGDNGVGWAPYGAANTPAVIWQFCEDSTFGDANAFRGTAEEFQLLIRSDNSVPIGTVPPVALAHPDDNRPIEVWDGVQFGPVGYKVVRIAGYYPDKDYLYVTSSLRDEPGSYHSGALRYGGERADAVDFGAGGRTALGDARMRDFAKWAYDKFGSKWVELIHSTPFADDQGFYVKNQTEYPGGGPYPPATIAAHFDHVHQATNIDLADGMLAVLEAEYQAKKAAGGYVGVEDAMAQLSQDSADNLIWQVDALFFNKPLLAGGPYKGQVNHALRGKLLVQQEGKKAVYLLNADAHLYRWVTTPAEVEKLAAQWGPVVTIPDVKAFGYRLCGPDSGE